MRMDKRTEADFGKVIAFRSGARKNGATVWPRGHAAEVILINGTRILPDLAPRSAAFAEEGSPIDAGSSPRHLVDQWITAGAPRPMNADEIDARFLQCLRDIRARAEAERETREITFGGDMYIDPTTGPQFLLPPATETGSPMERANRAGQPACELRPRRD